MSIIAALTTDSSKLAERVPELMEKVGAVNERINGLILTVVVVFSLLTYFGAKQAAGWMKGELLRLSTRSKLRSKFQIDRINASMLEASKRIERNAESRINELIAEKKKALADADAQLNAYLKQAEASASVIEQNSKNAELAGRSIIAWESGEIDIEFKNQGYRAEFEPFKNPFPVVPQVFVCDGAPNAWLIVKVDERHRDRFKWAVTIIGGPMPSHKTKLQWFAVSQAIPVDGKNMPPMNLSDSETAETVMRKLKEYAAAPRPSADERPKPSSGFSGLTSPKG